MFIINYNKNCIFKKFLNFYSYKIFLYLSNRNFYCYLFSFFKFNIIFNISTISLFLKNFILLNFGKYLNSNIFEFIGKCFSLIILDLKIYNLRFEIFNKLFNRNFKHFFIFLKKFIYY